ncbi:unnamed protein product, partial [Bubo scandiacus]
RDPYSMETPYGLVQYAGKNLHFSLKCCFHVLMYSIKTLASWRGYIVRKCKLRKQFFEERISNQLLSSYDINLADFFSKMDSSIAASQDVFQQLEGKELLTSETDWEKIQMQQEIFDCPICILPLSPTIHPACLSSGNSNQFSRQTVLLSCPHSCLYLFHHTSLQVFAEFSLGE